MATFGTAVGFVHITVTLPHGSMGIDEIADATGQVKQ